MNVGEKQRKTAWEDVHCFVLFFKTSINWVLLCTKRDARSWVKSNECNKYIFAHVGLSLAGETF